MAVARFTELEPGEFVHHQGDEINHFPVVVEGECDWQSHTDAAILGAFGANGMPIARPGAPASEETRRFGAPLHQLRVSLATTCMPQWGGACVTQHRQASSMGKLIAPRHLLRASSPSGRKSRMVGVDVNHPPPRARGTCGGGALEPGLLQRGDAGKAQGPPRRRPTPVRAGVQSCICVKRAAGDRRWGHRCARFTWMHLSGEPYPLCCDAMCDGVSIVITGKRNAYHLVHRRRRLCRHLDPLPLTPHDFTAILPLPLPLPPLDGVRVSWRSSRPP